MDQRKHRNGVDQTSFLLTRKIIKNHEINKNLKLNRQTCQKNL